MGSQKTNEQQRTTAELRALKVGAVVFAVIFAYTQHFFAACAMSLFATGFFFIPFFVLKAGLPLSYKKCGGFKFDDPIEARHKAELIDAPVTSALSVYRSAGSGYQMYHHHSKFYH